jgi:hypothetical protein
MEIPASVEIIGERAFNRYTALRAIIFLSDSNFREGDGFRQCKSFCRVEIPASIKWIDRIAFSEIGWMRELIFVSGMQIETSRDSRAIRAFVVSLDDEDVKQHRRGIHLSTVWRMMLEKIGLKIKNFRRRDIL